MSTPSLQHGADNAALARDIGERLKRARQAAGLTQAQLAGDRYTKAYVSALENGLSKPSVTAITYFADRLGISSSTFLRDTLDAWSLLDADLALASGRWREAGDAYGELLPGTSGSRRAEILLGLAEAFARLDQPRAGAAAAAEAASIFEHSGRLDDWARCRYWLANAEYQLGNSREATAILEAALSKVRGGLRVDPDFELRLVMALSSVASRDGHHDIALAYLEEVRALADELDDRRRASFLYDLAYSYRETGDLEAAIRAGSASLALFHSAQAELETGALENDLALSHLALGNVTKAREYVVASKTRFERLQDERWLAHVLETEAQIELASGDNDRATRLAEEARASAAAVGNVKAEISANLTLGRALARSAHADAAIAAFERAVVLARAQGTAPRIRETLRELADAVASSGDAMRAFELMREAASAT